MTIIGSFPMLFIVLLEVMSFLKMMKEDHIFEKAAALPKAS